MFASYSYWNGNSQPSTNSFRKLSDNLFGWFSYFDGYTYSNRRNLRLVNRSYNGIHYS